MGPGPLAGPSCREPSETAVAASGASLTGARGASEHERDHFVMQIEMAVSGRGGGDRASSSDHQDDVRPLLSSRVGPDEFRGDQLNTRRQDIRSQPRQSEVHMNMVAWWPLGHGHFPKNYTNASGAPEALPATLWRSVDPVVPLCGV